MRPDDELSALLLQAYEPCSNIDIISGICPQAKWAPEEGHIPRGFLGATGALEDVELVMVFAEPGHPHKEGEGPEKEVYDPEDSPHTLFENAMRHAYESFANGTNLIHRKVRWFMGELYPDLTFDEQLRHVWLTESRLCSIANKIGNVGGRQICADRYLRAELELLPNATVVAFGKKAGNYLRRLNIEYEEATAFSPPGAYNSEAQPSWDRVIEIVKSRRVQG